MRPVAVAVLAIAVDAPVSRLTSVTCPLVELEPERAELPGSATELEVQELVADACAPIQKRTLVVGRPRDDMSHDRLDDLRKLRERAIAELRRIVRVTPRGHLERTRNCGTLHEGHLDETHGLRPKAHPLDLLPAFVLHGHLTPQSVCSIASTNVLGGSSEPTE